ncbi:helix-turn-helix transcriptional regulator [Aestuariirhabdus litorea]|uniref:Helix-turn-helix domain-containing protein n=1 Tax=Aestuariirhabdus litorea TaxID=2528527 RepID=A0A3P3VS94_9GAMM|nr:helix-turn-helix transcriptional regulator [Aestuariirhabdus litorea]RRJ85314.1 helix-turn-helix domain-containing protein [Aestuariirhabdus litorea]RWW98536.1 helix-turn-helix domain-containing protein [Endozoicomonadaceae bacterium GTF-13]
MAQEFLTTRELAELLRIRERKVYDLVATGEVPCTRATGKLLFPRAGVMQWIASKGEGGQASVSTTQSSPRPGVVLGSHDPLLEWALRESGAGLAMLFDSSEDGLERFAGREGIATGLHLFESARQQWNRPRVAARFANEAVVLVEFARRQRGLIVAAGTAGSIKGLADLRQQTLVSRQPGAGSQALLEQLIAEAGLSADDFGPGELARSEADAALLVSQGKAAATLGLQSLAQAYRLDFVPLLEERYDLLVDRKAWFDEPWQRFVHFCQGEAFRQKAGEYRGYDVSGFGRVWYNAGA